MDKEDLMIDRLVELIYQIRDMVEEEDQRRKSGFPFTVGFQVEKVKAELERMIQAIELLGLKPTVEEKEEVREEEREENKK